jgi:hypothetical protein
MTAAFRLTPPELDNVWRHWWAGHMAAVGGASRLPLEPLGPDILNALNGGIVAPDPSTPKIESEANRATRRQQAHAERRDRLRQNPKLWPAASPKPKHVIPRAPRVAPRSKLNLPMAEWAKDLLGDRRISEVTLNDLLLGLDDYFEIFAKLRKLNPDGYLYFSHTGTPLWTRNIAIYRREYDAVRIPNADKLPSMFGFFMSMSKDEYRDEIINSHSSCLDFTYYEKVTRNFATVAPPGTTIFRENRVHLARDAFTKEEFKEIPTLRGFQNGLRNQWGYSWLIGVLPDGSIRALPMHTNRRQRLPSGHSVHHSAMKIPRWLYEKGKGDPHRFALRSFAIGLALATSVLSGVQVTIKRRDLGIRIGIPIDHAKSFFADRLPEEEGSRRKPIMHLRGAHLRKLAGGQFITVGDHLAGQRFFQWRGYDVKISAPGIHDPTPESLPDMILLEPGEAPPDPDDTMSLKEMLSEAVPWMWDRSRRARFRRGLPVQAYSKDGLLSEGEAALP